MRLCNSFGLLHELGKLVDVGEGGFLLHEPGLARMQGALVLNGLRQVGEEQFLIDLAYLRHDGDAADFAQRGLG